MQPKGSTVFKLLGKREYDRVQLQQPTSDERRPALKLRWLDTNTFMTTATLAPGKYVLAGRNSEGAYTMREILIEEGKVYYEVPEPAGRPGAVTAGPTVKGRLPSNALGAREIAVLFISQDIIVKRTTIRNGGFEVEAPGKGTYRLEVHALGAKPLSYYRNDLNIQAPVELGLIRMQ